jgi:hypothetical protein
MPVFNPNEPQNGEVVDADVLRNQFNALHDEATAPETDPVFAASEAAQFVAGDKAKLDSALQPGTALALNQSTPQTVTGGAPVLQAGLAIGTAALLPDGDGRLSVSGDRVTLFGNGSEIMLDSSGIYISINPNNRVKINSADVLTQESDPVFVASEAAQFAAGDKAKLDSALQPGADASAIAFTPGNASHWQVPAPSTLAEALDRLAARVSNNGANPV